MFEEDPILETPAANTFSLFRHLKPVHDLYKLVSLYPDSGMSGGSLNGAFVLQVIKDWKLENTDTLTELSNLTLLEYVGTLFNIVVRGITANPPKAQGIKE